MPIRHLVRGLALALAASVALLALLAGALAVVGWNWARGPLQDLALEKTGRVLLIGGDLRLSLAWPLPRVRAESVSFANPDWAAAPQMLTADAAEASIDLRQLLRGRFAFAELRLQRPRVFMEQIVGSGGVVRKTWLLDRTQTDEAARILIGRVVIDRGEASFTDKSERTQLHATLSTVDPPAADGAASAAAPTRSLDFTASGQWRGQALEARGSGGAVMAWRDESQPYPLQVTATLGRTQVQAQGTVTGLQAWSAADLRLSLRGDNLAALAPVLRLALPPSPPYAVQGRLVRDPASWRFDDFSGQVGRSDIAGRLQLATSGARPLLSGAVASRQLDLADLGPAVGARAAGAAGAAGAARMLPDIPFDTTHWTHMDADVTLSARTLLRRAALPLDQLQLRLVLNDRVLTLDPLSFGLAGGQLRARVQLDARAVPLRGQATLNVRGAQLVRLLPKTDLQNASTGRLDADATLSGHGASVAQLLATADGRVNLVLQDGLVSRLLVEQMGLHLLEILRLKVGGDETVPLNCVVADFGVTQGVMRVRTLVLDTKVNTVTGQGSISLARETLDLAFVPRTKVSSLLALRSPIYLRGTFARPVATVDVGRVATRGLGALALGLLNPLLALVPLLEPGPGADKPCGPLVAATRAAATTAGR